MDDYVHVRTVVVGGRLLQDFAAGLELVENLFEPKLIGLVDDDEQHLIVRMEFAFNQAERSLQIQELVDGEITTVISQLLFALKRALHRGSLVHRQGGSQWEEEGR